MGAFLGLISDFLIEECFGTHAVVEGGEMTFCQSNRNVLAKAVSCNFDHLFRICTVFKSLTTVSEYPGNVFVDLQERRPGLYTVKSPSNL